MLGPRGALEFAVPAVSGIGDLDVVYVPTRRREGQGHRPDSAPPAAAARHPGYDVQLGSVAKVSAGRRVGRHPGDLADRASRVRALEGKTLVAAGLRRALPAAGGAAARPPPQPAHPRPRPRVARPWPQTRRCFAPPAARRCTTSVSGSVLPRSAWPHWTTTWWRMTAALRRTKLLRDSLEACGAKAPPALCLLGSCSPAGAVTGGDWGLDSMTDSSTTWDDALLLLLLGDSPDCAVGAKPACPLSRMTILAQGRRRVTCSGWSPRCRRMLTLGERTRMQQLASSPRPSPRGRRARRPGPTLAALAQALRRRHLHVIQAESEEPSPVRGGGRSFGQRSLTQCSTWWPRSGRGEPREPPPRPGVARAVPSAARRAPRACPPHRVAPRGPRPQRRPESASSAWSS